MLAGLLLVLLALAVALAPGTPVTVLVDCAAAVGLALGTVVLEADRVGVAETLAEAVAAVVVLVESERPSA